MQKGFSAILILIGVVILGLVIGGAYYLGRSTSPKTSIDSDSLIDWFIKDEESLKT